VDPTFCTRYVFVSYFESRYRSIQQYSLPIGSTQVTSEKSAKYFGWTIVALSFVVLTAAYCLLYGYGAFLPLLTKDLSISSAEAAAPYSICIVTYSVMSLFSGRLTDRFGA
jgi:MFS family permease